MRTPSLPVFPDVLGEMMKFTKIDIVAEWHMDASAPALSLNP